MNMTIPTSSQQADLIYKVIGERSIYLTFLPPTIKKYEQAPLYFLIPGGGWHTEERESMLDFASESIKILRDKGYAIVSIDYRVYSEENVIMRDIISDCFDAMRYIAHFSDILEVDKNSVIVSGHSAGAHLALMLAYAPNDLFRNGSVFDDDFTVTAAAAFSPISILYSENVPQTIAFTAEGAFKGCDTQDERRLVSPIEYVSPSCPPTVLCAGTSDYLVFPNSSELLYEKLLENNVEAELILSVCGGHLYEQKHKTIKPSPSREEVLALATDFILKHLK